MRTQIGSSFGQDYFSFAFDLCAAPSCLFFLSLVAPPWRSVAGLSRSLRSVSRCCSALSPFSPPVASCSPGAPADSHRSSSTASNPAARPTPRHCCFPLCIHCSCRPCWCNRATRHLAASSLRSISLLEHRSVGASSKRRVTGAICALDQRGAQTHQRATENAPWRSLQPKLTRSLCILSHSSHSNSTLRARSPAEASFEIHTILRVASFRRLNCQRDSTADSRTCSTQVDTGSDVGWRVRLLSPHCPLSCDCAVLLRSSHVTARRRPISSELQAQGRVETNPERGDRPTTDQAEQHTGWRREAASKARLQTAAGRQ